MDSLSKNDLRDTARKKTKSAPSSGNDPLKRRYQVFVSSTYEDLKEERQHVMQALLETKCIPTGMELFPAASMEQWLLIKRVIDECDYYIVIIAGRYGSTDEKGVSFTEKEFDYAVETGKSVIGFVHNNIDQLAGIKLERNDTGRDRLKTFTAKVKRRLCRYWSTPDELASAVKSAVINELEFNPQPGWVRANQIPDPTVIAKLKQRIADLEERLKGRSFSQKSLPMADETVRIPTIVNLGFSSERGSRPGQTVNVVCHRTWDQILEIFAPLLKDVVNAMRLRKALEENILTEVRPKILKKLKAVDSGVDCEVDEKTFDYVISTMVTRKLLSIVSAQAGKMKGHVLELTRKGAEAIAEQKSRPSNIR